MSCLCHMFCLILSVFSMFYFRSFWANYICTERSHAQPLGVYAQTYTHKTRIHTCVCTRTHAHNTIHEIKTHTLAHRHWHWHRHRHGHGHGHWHRRRRRRRHTYMHRHKHMQTQIDRPKLNHGIGCTMKPQDLCARVTCLIYMCDMTHSYARHDSFIWVTLSYGGHSHMGKTHWHVRHDSFIPATRLIHTCDMLPTWLTYARGTSPT